MSAQLSNSQALGLHLSAGASDGYLTEAQYIYYAESNTSLESYLASLASDTEDSINSLTTSVDTLNTQLNNVIVSSSNLAVSQTSSTSSSIASAILQNNNYIIGNALLLNAVSNYKAYLSGSWKLTYDAIVYSNDTFSTTTNDLTMALGAVTYASFSELWTALVTASQNTFSSYKVLLNSTNKTLDLLYLDATVLSSVALSDIVSVSAALTSGVTIGTISIGGVDTVLYAPEDVIGSIVTFSANYTSGTKIGAITIDGTSTNIYAPTTSFTQTVTSGTQIGTIVADGSSKTIYAPTTSFTQSITSGTTLGTLVADGTSKVIYAPTTSFTQTITSGEALGTIVADGTSKVIYAPSVSYTGDDAGPWTGLTAGQLNVGSATYDITLPTWSDIFDDDETNATDTITNIISDWVSANISYPTNSYTATVTSGTKLGTIVSNGTSKVIYAPTTTITAVYSSGSSLANFTADGVSGVIYAPPLVYTNSVTASNKTTIGTLAFGTSTVTLYSPTPITEFNAYEGDVNSYSESSYFTVEVGTDYVSYFLDSASLIAAAVEEAVDSVDAANAINTLAYGVEWETGSSTCTRIGNMTFHADLPIQSQFKACIAKGTKIQYYLHPDDSNFKRQYSQSERYAYSLTGINETYATHISDYEEIFIPRVFGVDAMSSFLLVTMSAITVTENRIIRLLEDIVNCSEGALLGSLNRPVPVAIVAPGSDNGTGADTLLVKGIVYNPGSSTEVSTLLFSTNDSETLETIAEETEAGTADYYLVFGASLDGYDGAFRIEIPQCYYRSWKEDTTNRVMFSTTKIDSSWIELPHMLVDAVRPTILNTYLGDEDSYGWLGTLPANSLVSVVNYNTWCRGGINSSTYDTFLTEAYADIQNTMKASLAKPRTNLSRANFRKYCVNTGDGSQLLSYNYYKALFYWLWVIEYASFNCQNTFNSELTSEGYHQGGLSAGVTNLNSSAFAAMNSSQPVIQAGFCNTLGNNTGVLVIPAFTMTDYSTGGENTSYSQAAVNVPRWRGFDNPFGDIWTNLDGVNFWYDSTRSQYVLWSTDDASLFNDSNVDGFSLAAVTDVITSGNVYEFYVGESAEILPISTTSSKKYDYFYLSSEVGTTFRRFIVGGDAYNGSSAGLGFLHCIGAVSATDSSVGSRSLIVIDNPVTYEDSDNATLTWVEWS